MLSNVTILVTTHHLEPGHQQLSAVQLNSFTLTERGILLVRLTEDQSGLHVVHDVK